jgi:hypothetical protein
MLNAIHTCTHFHFSPLLVALDGWIPSSGVGSQQRNLLGWGTYYAGGIIIIRLCRAYHTSARADIHKKKI